MSRICLLCRENETTASDKTCQLCQENACDLIERNAELFAAAPELLEACKMMAGWINDLPVEVKQRHFPQLTEPEAVGLLWVYDVIDQAEGKGR